MPAAKKSSTNEISEEEFNTPLFCALKQGRFNQQLGGNSKIGTHQVGVMFWLGYLYKKKSQNHNEILVKIYNDNSQGRTAKEYKKDTAR